MSAQLRLSLERAAAYSADAFIVSDSNHLAARTLEGWPDWRGGALALVGPAGSGKTHLASIWAARHRATVLPLDQLHLEESPSLMLVENAEATLSEETLFHLLNLAARAGGGLLLTSRLAPSLWPVALPDLRSRLNALPVAVIEPPDDTVLTAMLDTFFHQRHIRASEELLGYLVRRIERSAQSALDIVVRLDEAAYALHRGVSRNLARQVLGEEDANGDDATVGARGS